MRENIECWELKLQEEVVRSASSVRLLSAKAEPNLERVEQ